MANVIKRITKPAQKAATPVATKTPAPVAKKPMPKVVAKPVVPKVSEEEIRELILGGLEANGSLDAAGILEATELTKGQVMPVLASLVEEGQVAQNGAEWFIPKPAEEEEEEEEEEEGLTLDDPLYMVNVFGPDPDDEETEGYQCVFADRDEAKATKEYNKLAKKGEDVTLTAAEITGGDEAEGFEVAEEVHQILPEVETPEDDEEEAEEEPEEDDAFADIDDDDLVAEYNALVEKKKPTKADGARQLELEGEIEKRGLFEEDGEGDGDELTFGAEEEPEAPEPKAGKGKAATTGEPLNNYVPMARLSKKDLQARIDEGTEAVGSLQEAGYQLAAEMLVRAIGKARIEIKTK